MNTSGFEVSPQYSFNIDHSGDTYTVTYKRSKYSLGMYFPLALLMGFVILMLTFTLSRHMTNGIILAVALPILTYMFLNMIRRDGKFQITPTHVTVNGRSFMRNHINRVYFELPGKYDQEVYIRSGMQGLADTMRSKMSDQIAAKNYVVGIVFAERHIKLAGGLNETSARVLHGKISEILNIYQ